MVNSLKVMALAAGLSLLAFAASAATVAVGGTGSTGAGGFTGPAGTVDTNNGAYTQAPTDPASNWVWVQNPTSTYITYDFTFTFDLTGYDLSTASLDGLWGVDNSGTVELNGTQVSSISYGYPAFQTMTAFTEAGAGFVDGVNTLTFHATNQGGPGAFRAAVTVTADLAPVPLPAALPLLAGAVGGLAFAARRRKRPV